MSEAAAGATAVVDLGLEGATRRAVGLVDLLTVPGAHWEYLFGQRSTGCSTPVGHGERWSSMLADAGDTA